MTTANRVAAAVAAVGLVSALVVWLVVPQTRVVFAVSPALLLALATVLVAGDDDAAKAAFIDLVKAGGLDAIDAGALKRARELEAFGFLQLVLAVQKKISFTAGFAVYR